MPSTDTSFQPKRPTFFHALPSSKGSSWLMRSAATLLFLSATAGTALLLPSCVASRLTDRISIKAGPSLNFPRMSAYLGAAKFPDGRVITIGGSPTETPFKPLMGKQAIEILSSNWSRWDTFDIDVKYPIAGRLFLLPDGRILVFSSILFLDPNSELTDPLPPAGQLDSGPVAAVIFDLDKKTQTPIFRPKKNQVGQPPLQGSFSLLQRAFDTTLQTKSGLIVRIGGELRYLTPAPIPSCDQGKCRYCQGQTCNPHPAGFDFSCEDVSQCPVVSSSRKTVVLDDIEIYTPPTEASPLGSVKTLKMREGRSSVAAVEIQEGIIFITGGWGPAGAGPNQAYRSTYFLNVKDGILLDGPSMLGYREDHAMVVLKSGSVLITGGTNENDVSVNTAEFFDPVTNQFTYAPVMTERREDQVPLAFGPWFLFIGGEIQDEADAILNTAEVYDAEKGIYVSNFSLFSLEGNPNDPTEGYAGISDFGAIRLDDTHLILFGGQQGLQDTEGRFISSGRGSTRTLILEFRP